MDHTLRAALPWPERLHSRRFCHTPSPSPVTRGALPPQPGTHCQAPTRCFAPLTSPDRPVRVSRHGQDLPHRLGTPWPPDRRYCHATTRHVTTRVPTHHHRRARDRADCRDQLVHPDRGVAALPGQRVVPHVRPPVHRLLPRRRTGSSNRSLRTSNRSRSTRTVTAANDANSADTGRRSRDTRPQPSARPRSSPRTPHDT